MHDHIAILRVLAGCEDIDHARLALRLAGYDLKYDCVVMVSKSQSMATLYISGVSLHYNGVGAVRYYYKEIPHHLRYLEKAYAAIV